MDQFYPTGRPLAMQILIFFPWNPAAGKFAGEKIYFDRKAMQVLGGE